MKTNIFYSDIHEVNELILPKFSDIRILHMPFALGDLDSIPSFLNHWKSFFQSMFDMIHVKSGIAYITIDEKNVKKGETHRRAGLHVDGVAEGKIGCCFGPSPGPGPTFGTMQDGMYSISSHAYCRAWKQEFSGLAGWDGECDHLLDQAKNESEIILKPNRLYWMGGLCVHESMPVKEDVQRTFVRVTMPNKNPWFDGFTLNPLGIKHEGPMYPRRTKYMDDYK